jgi:polyhydroxybutyrate depolymerase
VTFLHGLGDRGANFERALAVPRLARALDFAWFAPDGTVGPSGQRFWNAGRACCDFAQTGLDHAGAIAALPAEVERAGHASFGARVLVGFSNGAFLAHRIACDSGAIDAIVALAGAPPGPDDPPCKPGRAVAVIVVHGDEDRVVPYHGGPLLRRADRVVPSAAETAAHWAKRNGCTEGPGPETTRDVLSERPDSETSIVAYSGCRAPVELWTVRGADHLGVLSPALVEAALARALASR